MTGGGITHRLSILLSKTSMGNSGNVDLSWCGVSWKSLAHRMPKQMPLVSPCHQLLPKWSLVVHSSPQHESLTEIAYHWLSFVDAIFSLLISIIGFYTYMSSMSIPIKPLQMIVSNNHRHRRIAYSHRHRQSRVERVSAPAGNIPRHRKGSASWATHTLL